MMSVLAEERNMGILHFIVLGWPKSSLQFCIRYYRKIQTNIIVFIEPTQFNTSLYYASQILLFFFLINKLKACSNPAYRRFFGDIFEIVFAHFMSLYHMLVILTMKVKVKVALFCPTLYDSKNYTVHKILQAKILECVAFPFSMGPSQLRDQTRVSHIADRVFTS